MFATGLLNITAVINAVHPVGNECKGQIKEFKWAVWLSQLVDGRKSFGMFVQIGIFLTFSAIWGLFIATEKEALIPTQPFS